MRYQVPQFIEIEDKVVGPFTVKQFIYVVGGAFMSFIVYKLITIYIALPLIVGIEGLSLALAFYKVNNKPFIDFLESAFMFYSKDNLYIWKKEDKPIEQVEQNKEYDRVYVPKLSESKLKDLSWTIGVGKDSNSTSEN